MKSGFTDPHVGLQVELISSKFHACVCVFVCVSVSAAGETEFLTVTLSIRQWRCEIKDSWSSEGVPETSSSLTALPTAASGDNSLPSLSYQPQSPPIPLHRLVGSTHTYTHSCTFTHTQAVSRGFSSSAKPVPHLQLHSYTHTHTRAEAVAHQKAVHQKHAAEYFAFWKDEETPSPAKKDSRNLHTEMILHHTRLEWVAINLTALLNKKLPINSKEHSHKMAPAWRAGNKTVIKQAAPSGSPTPSWGSQTSGCIYSFQLFATPPQINLGALMPSLRTAPKQTRSTLSDPLTQSSLHAPASKSKPGWLTQANKFVKRRRRRP